MKLKKLLLLIVAAVFAATVSEGSLLVRRSLLQRENECFTCRPGERPFAYPLIHHFVKLKDMAVKAFKAIVATAKEQLT